MPKTDCWQPTASRQVLRQRAALLAKLRTYFAELQVLEVDVPTLGCHTITDPQLIPIIAQVNNRAGYLQTSPEYFMKRLLASGSGCIYYLGKSFRDQEYGRKHQPEFTMLEWYRLGLNDRQLITEVLALLGQLLPDKPQVCLSYRQLFEQRFAINPHSASVDQLQSLAEAHCTAAFAEADRNTWLDLLFTHCIEPELKGVFAVYDFPASQGALAKVSSNEHGDAVAHRFEIYVDGIELANGYWELTDAEELARRARADQQQRQAMGKPVPEADPALLAAHVHGLPECAGVAMGVDRLLMAMLGKSDIAAVVPFTPFAVSGSC